MTGNQIAYARYLEDQRHNLASESLSARSISESERHNRETERYSWSSLLEATRHNQQTESLGWASLAETERHNKAGEAYNISYLSELTRHNKAGEAISWYNANTQYQSMLEQARHNQAVEAETYRSNYANEQFQYYKYPYSLFLNPTHASSAQQQYVGALTDIGVGYWGNWSQHASQWVRDVKTDSSNWSNYIGSLATGFWNWLVPNTLHNSSSNNHGKGAGRPGQ